MRKLVLVAALALLVAVWPLAVRDTQVSSAIGLLTSTLGTPDTIATVAGGGIGDGGPAQTASLLSPSGAAVASNGDVYVASGARVRKISSGVISTVAGRGYCGNSGDGGPAVDACVNPFRVALHGSDLYVLDYFDCVVRKISDGIITTVAGNGTCGFSGDGGPAPEASLHDPSDVAVDANGVVYIADQRNGRVRKVAGGVITTFSGDGYCGGTGDGGPAAAAQDCPTAITVDAAGNLYFDDLGCRLRRVDALTNIITTVLGSASACWTAGDTLPADGPPIDSYVIGLATDASGAVYITDPHSCRVRRVDPSAWSVTFVAGNGTSCAGNADDGPALSAALSRPIGLPSRRKVLSTWPRRAVAASAKCRAG